MLTPEDLQMLGKLIDDSIRASEGRMATMMDERISVSETRVASMMDERISASETRMAAMMDEKIGASETRVAAMVDDKIRSSEGRMMAYMESHIEKKIDLLAEGIQANSERLDRVETRLDEMSEDLTAHTLYILRDVSKKKARTGE